MGDYDYFDTPFKELEENNVGKKVDKKIRDMISLDWNELESLEFDDEFEVETFERFTKKNKRVGY